MKKLVVCCIVLLLFLVSFASAITFSDLEGYGSNYVEAITNLSERKVINGYPDGTYKPENNVTRVEFLKMVLWAAEKDNWTDKSSKTFSDIAEDTWEARVTNKAVELWIISKDNKEFRPTANITRAEAMKMLMNTMELKKSDATESSFSDVTWWAIAYIDWAKDLWLVSANTKFRPEDNMTRAEAAKVLTLAMKLEKTPENTDNSGNEESNSWDTENVGMANPASVYCVEQWGESVIVEDEEWNQTWMCKLADGTEVEEWEYYRANNPENTETNSWATESNSWSTDESTSTWTTESTETWSTETGSTNTNSWTVDNWSTTPVENSNSGSTDESGTWTTVTDENKPE